MTMGKTMPPHTSFHGLNLAFWVEREDNLRMATLAANPLESPMISVEEYLRTSYRPDCDYVDGVIEERNVGEWEHSQIQSRLLKWMSKYEEEWRVDSVVEQRLQVAEQRYRVPDVMILWRSQRVDRIVREAPLVCIEVLSPEDSWTRIRARLNDYLAMGVEHIWCFDPDSREVRRYTTSGFAVVTEPVLEVAGTPIRLVLAEIFSVLEPR
jgi:Uma2 family endonuclease